MLLKVSPSKNYDKQLSYIFPSASLSSSSSTINIRTRQVIISKELGFSMIAKGRVVMQTLYCDNDSWEEKKSARFSHHQWHFLRTGSYSIFFFLLINRLLVISKAKQGWQIWNPDGYICYSSFSTNLGYEVRSPNAASLPQLFCFLIKRGTFTRAAYFSSVTICVQVWIWQTLCHANEKPDLE